MGRPSKSTTEIARKRIQLGLTQPELASILGMSRDSISSMEIGRMAISPRTAIQLSRLTEKDADVRVILEKHVTEYRERIYREAGIPL